MTDFIFRDQQVSVMRQMYVLFTVISLIALVIVNIFISGRMVSTGTEMRSIERAQVQLELEQKSLQAKLAEKQSLQHIKEEAKQLGYIPVSSVLHARQDVSVALR